MRGIVLFSGGCLLIYWFITEVFSEFGIGFGILVLLAILIIFFTK